MIERSVEFLEELLWDHLEKAEKNEMEWRKLDAKEARRFFKEKARYYRLLEEIQEIKGWYSYKNGIGT